MISPDSGATVAIVQPERDNFAAGVCAIPVSVSDFLAAPVRADGVAVGDRLMRQAKPATDQF